jgi:hypothetical protein
MVPAQKELTELNYLWGVLNFGLYKDSSMRVIHHSGAWTLLDPKTDIFHKIVMSRSLFNMAHMTSHQTYRLYILFHHSKQIILNVIDNIHRRHAMCMPKGARVHTQLSLVYRGCENSHIRDKS